MAPTFSQNRDVAIPLHVIDQSEVETWLTDQSEPVKSWADANGFKASRAQTLLIPGVDGRPIMALAGYGTASQRAKRRFHLAGIAGNLPQGTYQIASGIDAEHLDVECFGWLMSSYRFDRYRDHNLPDVHLVAPDDVDAGRPGPKCVMSAPLTWRFRVGRSPPLFYFVGQTTPWSFFVTGPRPL